MQKGWLTAEICACKNRRVNDLAEKSPAVFFTKRPAAAQPGVARRSPRARWTDNAFAHTPRPFWYAGERPWPCWMAPNAPFWTLSGGPSRRGVGGGQWQPGACWCTRLISTNTAHPPGTAGEPWLGRSRQFLFTRRSRLSKLSQNSP